MDKNVIVIGLGGVGGYFGFKIAQNNLDRKKYKTTFVARGETFKIVRENGLTLLSSEHPDPIAKPDFLVRNVKEIPRADLILICVKEYDLEDVCLKLKEKADENSVILPLMNGVDIYERIRKIIENAVVLPACVYVASHIKAKGVVEHKGKPGKIIFGKDPQKPDKDAQWIYELLKKSGIDADYKEDAFPDIWTKFVFIAGFGLVSARFNKSIGQVAEEPELRAQATEIMREIAEIADKKGVRLPDDIIKLTFEKAAAFPYDTPTSLQLDVQSGKVQNELELFAGAILRYGKETNTPVNQTAEIYREIKNLKIGKDVFKELADLGAEELRHPSGNLMSHLEGTRRLLESWGNRDELCRAGLYHAVYGTFAFQNNLVEIGKRKQIAALIGDEAEKIVYYYCACDREFFYPQIGRVEKPVFLNRFTGKKETLAPQMFRDLLELTLANELEILKTDADFPAKQKTEFEQFFERLEPFVSAKGFTEFRRLFNEKNDENFRRLPPWRNRRADGRI